MAPRMGPKLGNALLALLLGALARLELAAAQAAAAQLPCLESSYCSLGKTKPFVGEVDSSLGLRAALAARSYRGEVILMATDTQRMLQPLQAVSNLARLGFEHVLMMGPSAPDCMRIAAALPSLGCVWSDFELPVIGEDRELVVEAIPLWHNRYRLLARCVRLRYNVLLLDADVIIFRDPYKYLKQPPFSQFTIINQPEVLYEEEDYVYEVDPNGGVLYVQNAAPDGPAAWLLAETSDRLLRWIDDGFNLTRYTHYLHTWCNYMDQDGLKDAISSVLTGRILFSETMRNCRTDEFKSQQGSAHAAIVAALDALIDRPRAYTMADVQLPASMVQAAGASKVTIKYFNMTLPRYMPWNESYGPWLYPPARGPLSRRWQRQLKEDCGCPLWPDPESPDTQAVAKAAATPKESFLLAPPFLMLNWFARGRRGFWHRALTGPDGPQQVIGHLHYIPGTDLHISKVVAKMAVGHYDWGLARSLLGSRMYFLHLGSPGGNTSPEDAHAPLHFLTYHPSLAPMARTATWREYQELLLSLAMVAVTLKRIPVWPDIPCNVSWIAEEGPKGAGQLPLQQRMEFIPYGRKRGAFMCTWLPLLNDGCLTRKRGMLWMEFEHFRHQRRMASGWEPGPLNTIASLDGSVAPLAADQSLAARIWNVAQQQVDMAWGMRKTHMHRVLYLTQPLNVTFLGGQYEQAMLAFTSVENECKAMSEELIQEDLADKPYRHLVEPSLGWQAAQISLNGTIRPAEAIPGWNVRVPEPPAPSADKAKGASGAASTMQQPQHWPHIHQHQQKQLQPNSSAVANTTVAVTSAASNATSSVPANMSGATINSTSIGNGTAAATLPAAQQEPGATAGVAAVAAANQTAAVNGR